MKINSHAQKPTQADIDLLSHWVMILPAKVLETAPDFPYIDVFKQRYLRRHQHQESPLVIELPNPSASLVTLGFSPEIHAPFECLTLARQLVTNHVVYHPQVLGICIAGFAEPFAMQLAEAIIAAALAAVAEMPTFKNHAKSINNTFSQVELYGVSSPDEFAQTRAEAVGNNLARYLSVLPANKLTPLLYRQKVERLADEHGWESKFYDLQALRTKHAGAFLAVTQASETMDGGLLLLRYRPVKFSKKVALVGKGVCFDTGGVHLKTRVAMANMHMDMQGSAVALGTLLALSLLKVDFAVDCWLALAENHISALAYKSNDVVQASNGLTIEITDSDAEGRLLLADALVLASEEKPDVMIDYATLTYGCVIALGTAYSGLFCNRENLLALLVETGRLSGERVWGFPWDADYDARLQSEIADIKQCPTDNEDSEADHIYATRFLSRFVDPAIAWIHIDLSSHYHEDGLAHIPTAVTGFGVRYTVHLLRQQGLLSLV
ncbi:M17 family metallopeptidase [Beggiatoa leptomitoformis]|uniref:Leucyl aminopeptidase family protein n=1 Tax=Beggiatoa leptomitoformis TaxID=288004 RepID=A0A2N9YDA5_9GAMM|nr:M17 family metallopeptidase [Beggiatoa leptomitoformis]ALG69108.1 leucyl aminopeptidase family protein [Beggiatoa leptomitoformis]AUI68478.1 leucyl aminopeptidase family protein [Beggiatoa leptomitoformis]